jgi:DnaJ-class molecular chaperone
MWIYLLSLPLAALLTFLYWQTFHGTQVCPTCKGTGKIEVQQGGEVETDVCYSCDGEGRVPR